MLEETKQIYISAKQNAPATTLFVKTVAQNKFNDKPVAFILPGGPGMDHTPYQTYTHLLDVVDIVFHDPRGCGKSDKNNPSSFTMDNYIDDIEAIRQALNLNKIIVIGKSYGSMCALGYALRYSQNVSKLILAAGAPSFRFIETARQNLLRRGTPEQINWGEKIWNGSFTNTHEVLDFLQVMAPLYSNKAKTEPASYNLSQATGFSWEALNLGFTDFLKKFDFENELHHITCPTLILAGQDDWVNDIQHAKLMAEKIPHSQLKSFPHSGHAMESDVTDEFFQAIREFI